MELKGVSKHYGDIVALDDVNLSIRNKEYLCVVGPSGCGKSTLIKCVAGIIQPDEGEILLDGRTLRDTMIEDRRIGYVFQEIALFPHMTVRDNVSYGPVVRNAAEEQIATVTNEMLDLTSMRDRSRAYPMELSGGAQQKVAVARAVATSSQLFLLDEPLGALDALVRTELRYELKRLATDLGLTIIHVTHDQEEALSIADRVVIMKRGQVVEVGTPSEIYLHPKTLFTENFVGETNLLEGRVVQSNNGTCTVEVGGLRVSAISRPRNPGEKVIVSVRPEFVSLLRPESPTRNEWGGRIEQATFLGGITRYVVRLDVGVDIVAQIPWAGGSSEFQVGDTVNVPLAQTEHILLFDQPPEGLEKEIALE